MLFPSSRWQLHDPLPTKSFHQGSPKDLWLDLAGAIQRTHLKENTMQMELLPVANSETVTRFPQQEIEMDRQVLRTTSTRPPAKHRSESIKKETFLEKEGQNIARDRSVLALRRNEAESRLRERFLKFGASRISNSSRHKNERGTNGVERSDYVYVENHESLAMLRKRRQQLESLSSPSSESSSDRGIVSSANDLVPKTSSADRRKRIEILRNRRKQLEVRIMSFFPSERVVKSVGPAGLLCCDPIAS